MHEPSDVAVAPGLEPAVWAAGRNDGGSWRAGRWQPAEISRLLAHLSQAGAAALAAIATEDLLAAWDAALDTLLDRSTGAARLPAEAARTIAAGVRLSLPGLAAGLGVVLAGQRRPAADRLAALSTRAAGPPRAVFLAGNLPGLAAQPLLRALLAGRPVLLKSAGNEPLFAPLLVRALRERLRALAPALAALSWPGGDEALEAPILAAAEVEAYGGAAAIAALTRRAPGLLAHGPRASVGVVLDEPRAEEGTATAGSLRIDTRDAAATAGQGGDARGVAYRLAQDVARFDQRGCLSVQAIYVVGPPERASAFAQELLTGLAALADEWPPGPPAAVELSAVQQCRALADLQGLATYALAPAAGTVLVDPTPRFLPSPGLRTVRVHPLARAEQLLEVLAPWRGRLQGVAVAGELPTTIRTGLLALGVTRLAPAGALQHADATWPNWGERLEGP